MVILNLFFTSGSNILLVGDPRQVTYLTHHSSKYKKYRDGKLKEFIEIECRKGICDVDTKTLNKTHRNNKDISEFSSRSSACIIVRIYRFNINGIFGIFVGRELG